ncbi:OLC1v1020650C1 [Oldenlandia corymbosa var. corymbosa]|uniref:OLC1v1020650C1 n=1 Tax=Oldenlandia corymbosa var. corymbosa TaxID=529605 RepID=A0AAV1EHE4_OLDCO|nr:OLC1v1020650C1 [Oldenlandia corymbosa var. corymbosa]
MGGRRAFADSEEAYKSHLVTEICNISSNLEKGHCCVHQRPHLYHLSHKKPFLDWYLVLGVDENAGLDIIRKSYLRLALLVHPDKNKHPKADIAFKLISEAYACLSDNTIRTSFNVERQKKNICTECCIRHDIIRIQGRVIG